MMYEEQGLPRVISYFNGWLKNIPELGDVLIVRYEDMRKDPASAVRSVLAFTGTPGSEQEIADAVEFARFENLKKREAETSFKPKGGWRLVPGDRKNPDSFKVRRAKVGGYRDYFTDEELARIDAMVDSDLLPQIGYTSAECPSPQAVESEVPGA